MAAAEGNRQGDESRYKLDADLLNRIGQSVSDRTCQLPGCAQRRQVLIDCVVYLRNVSKNFVEHKKRETELIALELEKENLKKNQATQDSNRRQLQETIYQRDYEIKDLKAKIENLEIAGQLNDNADLQTQYDAARAKNIQLEASIKELKGRIKIISAAEAQLTDVKKSKERHLREVEEKHAHDTEKINQLRAEKSEQKTLLADMRKLFIRCLRANINAITQKDITESLDILTRTGSMKDGSMLKIIEKELARRANMDTIIDEVKCAKIEQSSPHKDKKSTSDQNIMRPDSTVNDDHDPKPSIELASSVSREVVIGDDDSDEQDSDNNFVEVKPKISDTDLVTMVSGMKMMIETMNIELGRKLPPPLSIKQREPTNNKKMPDEIDLQRKPQIMRSMLPRKRKAATTDESSVFEKYNKVDQPTTSESFATDEPAALEQLTRIRQSTISTEQRQALIERAKNIKTTALTTSVKLEKDSKRLKPNSTNIKTKTKIPEIENTNVVDKEKMPKSLSPSKELDLLHPENQETCKKITKGRQEEMNVQSSDEDELDHKLELDTCDNNDVIIPTNASDSVKNTSSQKLESAPKLTPLCEANVDKPSTSAVLSEITKTAVIKTAAALEKHPLFRQKFDRKPLPRRIMSAVDTCLRSRLVIEKRADNLYSEDFELHEIARALVEYCIESQDAANMWHMLSLRATHRSPSDIQKPVATKTERDIAELARLCALPQAYGHTLIDVICAEINQYVILQCASKDAQSLTFEPLLRLYFMLVNKIDSTLQNLMSQLTRCAAPDQMLKICIFATFILADDLQIKLFSPGTPLTDLLTACKDNNQLNVILNVARKLCPDSKLVKVIDSATNDDDRVNTANAFALALMPFRINRFDFDDKASVEYEKLKDGEIEVRLGAHVNTALDELLKYWSAPDWHYQRQSQMKILVDLLNQTAQSIDNARTRTVENDATTQLIVIPYLIGHYCCVTSDVTELSKPLSDLVEAIQRLALRKPPSENIKLYVVALNFCRLLLNTDGVEANQKMQLNITIHRLIEIL